MKNIDNKKSIRGFTFHRTNEKKICNRLFGGVSSDKLVVYIKSLKNKEDNRNDC